MILADELASIEEKLKQQASKKELALYLRLIGNSLPYPGDDELNDIEQVCLSAFCSGAPNKLDLIERFRRSKPIKGIHYANNLVELAAFATHAREAEADHLKSFCATSSARDCLILNHLFPGVCSSLPSASRAVDLVATWLDKDSFPDDWQSPFLDAMQNANDLLDLYVLRRSYIHLWMCHSSTEQVRGLQYLGSQLERVMTYIKGRSNRRFNTITVTIIIVVFVLIAYFAIRNWEIAESLIWVFTVGIGLVVFLVLVLFGKRLDKVHIVEQMRASWAQAALLKLGLDAEAIQKVMTKYAGTDTDGDIQKLKKS
jgi:hypothetical protein